MAKIRMATSPSALASPRMIQRPPTRFEIPAPSCAPTTAPAAKPSAMTAPVAAPQMRPVWPRRRMASFAGTFQEAESRVTKVGAIVPAVGRRSGTLGEHDEGLEAPEGVA